MNDDEIWELAKQPVTEFIDSIKDMKVRIEKLVEFYMSQTRNKANEGIEAKACQEQDIKQTLSPLAKAKLELAIVFSINACYWMYLVSHGEDPQKNDIAKDIERVRLFMNRAQEVERSLMPEKKSGVKRPKIDKEASKRLCRNNISMKSDWDT